MRVQIIQVPYDSGHRAVRMGAGPEHFTQNGLAQTLTDYGYQVSVESVEADNSFRAEIKTTFEVYRRLSERVGSAYEDGVFPLVLSGNCNSSLGTIAGVKPEDTGVIWFDSHGDFNNPDTTESGFLDGMGLATVAGLCWRKMASSIFGFKPVPTENILHVGGRDWYSEEKAMFENGGGIICGAEPIRALGVSEGLTRALDQLRNRVSRIYLHFDLDVLDPETARANEFAAPDGLSVDQIREAIQLIGERFTICATGLASYDPRFDANGEVLKAGIAIIKSVLTTVKSNQGKPKRSTNEQLI